MFESAARGFKRLRHSARYLVPAPWEKRDAGFRALIRNLSLRGLRTVGILGVLGSSTYVAFSLMMGRRPSLFDYGDPNALVMWDKLLFIVLGIVCLVPRLARVSARAGRLTIAAVVLVAAFASITDDLARGHTDFSAAWLSLMLIVAIAALPYKPTQTVSLGMALTAVFLLTGPVVSLFEPGLGSVSHDREQVAFLIVLTIVCTGISALIYSSRYHLYVRRKRISDLERLTKRRFSMYVAGDVVKDILRRPDRLALGGETRRVTMLMSDLRGFSLLTESLSPDRVVDLLNIYLGQMADVVMRYGGTIDEFIGDAIFVIFGAPSNQPDHAIRAVACAIDMQRHMQEVNRELESKGIAPVEMGIGVHTGEVVVGSIGSNMRAKYGAVGSHVNLTARIESYTVGGQVLTTDSTLTEAGSAVEVGRQMMLSTKGFTEPISIHEVEGIGDPYHLRLPVWVQKLRDIEPPWPFTYCVLDGKHLTGPMGTGSILRLSTTGAVVRLSHRVEVLSNLKMQLQGSTDEGEAIGDLYCKVVEEEADDLHVRFTAVPTEVAERILEACVVGDRQPS